MRWQAVLIALLLLSLNSQAATRSEQPHLAGVHASLQCMDCHGANVAARPHPSSAEIRAEGCTGCHEGYDRIFDQAMTTRVAEKRFVAENFEPFDPKFFEKNCNDCHVSDCLDCHGGDGHAIAPASQNACLACHKGYFVGREYLGMAPREDHPRYQRGDTFMGETFLKMRPDLHAELEMTCIDCHSMQSLMQGQSASKRCTDCHQPDPTVIDHRIDAHMTGMECYACHAAWAPQAYGTFYLRTGGDEQVAKPFRIPVEDNGDYLISTYLRRQDAPPLGVNDQGRISPIRPQFIAYYSDLRGGVEPQVENRLVAAQIIPLRKRRRVRPAFSIFRYTLSYTPASWQQSPGSVADQ
ncbi:MAG: selenite/tellurite reduction operon b-type cytochrome iron-sulfur cluster-binding subunit ExtO [Desulfuromonadales bacterium]